MKKIKTEIIINASPEKVWNELLNFSAYSEWNPFILIEGEAVEGSRLKNTMTLEGQKPQVFKPQVLEVDENKAFRWEGHLLVKGLFDGEHYFLLEDIGNGTTRFIHGENFRGILSGLIMKMIGTQTEQAFVKMNKAIKARCEHI